MGSAYTVEVITPLFGGGVEPGENDPETLVRGSAIRGHLRFWWRATRGARFQTAAELAEAEGRIWGTTTDPSRVELSIAITKPGKQESCESLTKRDRLAYALFPFQGNPREGKLPRKCTRDLEFTMRLRYPNDLALEVEASVWAWVNFGGLGARTRRGCGALFCRTLAPASAGEVAAWFEEKRTALGVTGDSLRDWPVLGSVYLHSQAGDPVDGWSKAISVLHRFRQGDIGRNPGQGGRPGRTRWPEADSLRALTGQKDDRHAKSITLTDPKSSPAFPRARLGLPIVFHFKDREDPKQLELYPDIEGSTRMASPVILRPLAIGRGSMALPMMVRLKARAPQALRLSNAGLGTFTGERSFMRADLATYTNSPMQKRSDKGSVLAAFLTLAKEEGFREVR